MDTEENGSESNDLPEVITELPVICQLDVDKVELIDNKGDAKNPTKGKNETISAMEEETETTSSVKDLETSKSPVIAKVTKKKKPTGFQAPKKPPSMSTADMDEKVKPQKTKKSPDPTTEQGLNDDKKEKSEKKKKPKNSIDTKEGVDSKEMKPKKIKKVNKKQTNDVDKEKDSSKTVAGDVLVPSVDDSIQTSAMSSECVKGDDSVQTSTMPSECVKGDDTTESKKENTAKIEKREKASEPTKSLSAEEWEQLFQSAIDRVMNTPLDQLVPIDEALVQNTTMQNDVEGEDEAEDVNSVDGSQNGLTVDQQEIVDPGQVQENSRNYNFPLENEHVEMVECAQVQELNENTPEGSELEFDGEEQVKKLQHTPIQVKKAIKKADRNSAAKVLAPRQLHFPKPSVDTEKQRKKDLKEIKKEKKKMKMTDVVKKEEKGMKFAENMNDQPRSKKQLMMEREIEETGTWVQCSNTLCHKWRFLQDINDPTEIDEKWICKMNKDPTYNSCEKGEQDYDESDHIYTRYSEGSVVWARMVGYPWWPAMVEIDPDTETFFELVSENSMFPSHYHVVYLDKKVSRAWVKASAMLPFNHSGEDLNKDLYLTKKSKGPNFKKEVEDATQNALTALELPTKERLKQFGFSARFKGKWAEDETKARKIKKHCRVKLTPKKSKKKGKKQKENNDENTSKHEDLAMYMLDASTVDEMLSDQPDSILKGIEDVLDSLGSQIMSDDNDEDYVPTNTECEMGTESTESKTILSPMKKFKGTKRKNMSKEGERNISKKSKKHKKPEDVPGKTSEKKKEKKMKKFKRETDKTITENKTDFSLGTLVELAENKINVCNLSKSDSCVKKETSAEDHLTTSTTTAIKFDSDIFTMELDDDEECENIPKKGKKNKKREVNSPLVTPEKKEKSNPITKPEKKMKKNLFTVPETTSSEKKTENHSKSSSDKNMSSKKSSGENVISPVQQNLMKTSESTAEKNQQKNDENSSLCDSKDLQKNLLTSSKKKTCPKKVSFSAPARVTTEAKVNVPPARVTTEPKVNVPPVEKETHIVSFNDEQTVPDLHSQEPEEEDEFSLDLPVCEQKPEIQEVKITSVSILPVAVDTVDAYDSDPFDMMEE